MSDFFSGRSGGGGRGGGLAGGLSTGLKAAAVALLIQQLMKHARGGSGAGGVPAGGGGLGGLLGGLFGGGGGTATGNPSAGGGGLGGLFGGAGGAGGLGGLLGGLGGLLGGLRGQGLGNQVDSWVSTGPNQPVSPRELERAFDPQELDEIARRAGTDRGTLLNEVSQVLPDFVDRMTPRGQVPQREEELGGGGLGGLLGDLFGVGGGGPAAAGRGDVPEAGAGAMGGLAGMLGGGAGGAAAHHPGVGGSLDESMGRIGPAPAPDDGGKSGPGLGGGAKAPLRDKPPPLRRG